MSVKPKFHYADFPETSPDGEVGVMEFGIKGTSRVCRGRHGEVGIVEFGLNTAIKHRDQRQINAVDQQQQQKLQQQQRSSVSQDTLRLLHAGRYDTTTNTLYCRQPPSNLSSAFQLFYFLLFISIFVPGTGSPVATNVVLLVLGVVVIRFSIY